MTDILLHGDVDAIKNFVFETSSLPQIRGGSQLLIDCEEKISQLIKEETNQEPIYCNGGSFLANIPEDKVESIQQTIEQLYLDKTHVSTITITSKRPIETVIANLSQDGWAKRLEQASNQTGFGYQVAFLASQVREKKTHKKNAPFFEAIPFGKRCEVCGMRMATTQIERRNANNQEDISIQSLCPVCQVRHERGQIGAEIAVRGQFNKRFSEKFFPKARQAPDLDNLVDSGGRKYLAFIYADGNNIGGQLQLLTDRDKYLEFSEALKMSTEEALFESLAEVCGADLAQEQRCWPFEIVNVGGDDVTILIQAWYAWDVAVKFLERFEAKIQARLGKKITASCGIAMTHAHYPMSCLQQLAEGLLKQAKQGAKKNPKSSESAIDFMWLRNGVISEEIEPLLTHYTYGAVKLTARPYTLTEAKKISALVQQAAQWSRHQRHQWGEAIEQGPWISLVRIYYNIARRGKEERQALIEFMNQVGGLRGADYPSHLIPGLWQHDIEKEHYYTVLLDVLELAELHAMRPKVYQEELNVSS